MTTDDREAAILAKIYSFLIDRYGSDKSISVGARASRCRSEAVDAPTLALPASVEVVERKEHREDTMVDTSAEDSSSDVRRHG